MSRRRAADPTTAISITLPRSLLDKIDDELTRTYSRYLQSSGQSLCIETRQLMAMLHARATADGDATMATLLLDRLTS